MRLKFSEEAKIRKAVDEEIKASVRTTRIVYPQPDTIVFLMGEKGIKTNRQFVTRRYGDMGIVYRDGLWVKKLELNDSKKKGK